MSQKEIEVILTRQLAYHLAMPIFLTDMDGNLIFYNEPAEKILGRRFDETGEMPASEWATGFLPTDSNGNALKAEELPLMIALTKKRPAHLRFSIKSYDNMPRHIEVTAFPLVGQGSRCLGAVAIFWEVGKE